MAVTVNGSKKLFKLLHVHLQMGNFANVTQRNIAELTGIHETTISGFKKGHVIVNKIEHFVLFAGFLGQPIEYLYDIASERLEPPETKTIIQIRREHKESIRYEKR